MKQEQLQLTGANNRGDRRKLDFYPTPTSATTGVMKFLYDNYVLPKRDGSVIWEPACGNLAMVKPMEAFGHRVIATDIISGQDFLTYQPNEPFDAIITNPPFDISDKFITRGLELAPVVCLLLKSQYWHAKKRYNLFMKHKPAFICPLTWWVDFYEHERKPGEKGRPTMEVAWNIWISDKEDAKVVPLLKP